MVQPAFYIWGRILRCAVAYDRIEYGMLENCLFRIPNTVVVWSVLA